MTENIALPLCRHSLERPDALALSVNGRELSYRELATLSRRIASCLQTVARTRRVGILATRSLAACAGILGTAWSGSTYVPLNPRLPQARLVDLFSTLDLDALIVDARGAALLTPEVLAAAPRTVLAGDEGIPSADGTNIRSFSMLDDPGPDKPADIAEDHLAYIEFTSGTTGTPKGVMVPVSAVNHYLKVMQNWFGLTPDDRAAETCDITFDLSVHNMFLTWHAGASLHVMNPLQMVAPARFIRDRAITSWLSVPSIIAMMRQNRTLEADTLPSLRLSFFCGEPLPAGAARAWAKAAPNSRIENIYGPTEATIACLRQPVIEPIAITPNREIVAIGRAYPRMAARIVDMGLRPLPSGTPGEIALSGAQLAKGYFGQPELTAERFPLIDGERWYLTGDLGVEDEDGTLHHLGRLDNQVKVLGNRVELEEIEMHLRATSKSDHVAAVAWPLADGSAKGIVGFVSGAALDAATIKEELRKRLPSYMVPSVVHRVGDLPLNGNGKVDRKALVTRLDAGTVAVTEKAL
ncbi:amino acid adenylation domain-containing protein [Rhizobium jaguaris]|uniref:Amino acid adenylation domain-containing protein n=1 Tax=Rhizobium jaguaris TaxID=1312183 RepID=A0A387FLS6_9HYPH|nr:amino acid adenylation domain-containing protein [Rhizobium jaguaris]AYG59828.1 amino acid adenylation domain-containing protein [Rhizobium jaguaris]